MQYFGVFLINGFLLSITPATVTDSKCSNQLPVIQDNCNDSFKHSPFVQPQPQHGTGDIKIEENTDEKDITVPDCPEVKSC